MASYQTLNGDAIAAEGTPGLVSIIIPTFDRSTELILALESVRAQDYRPLEVVVVDDGSTDSTRATIEHWSQQYTSSDFAIHYIRIQQSGAPTARNVGIEVATGEYLKFLDSDDRLVQGVISRHAGVLASQPDLDFVWSDSASTAFPDLVPPLHTLAPVRVYRGKQRRHFPLRVADGTAKRRAVRIAGLWAPDLARYQDWEYSIRLASACRAIARSPGVGYVVLLHQGERISRTSPSIFADQILAAEELARGLAPAGHVDAHISAFKRGQALLSASLLYCYAQRVAQGRSASLKAVRVAPRSTLKLKAALWWAVVTLSPKKVAVAISRRSVRGLGEAADYMV